MFLALFQGVNILKSYFNIFFPLLFLMYCTHSILYTCTAALQDGFVVLFNTVYYILTFNSIIFIVWIYDSIRSMSDKYQTLNFSVCNSDSMAVPLSPVKGKSLIRNLNFFPLIPVSQLLLARLRVMRSYTCAYDFNFYQNDWTGWTEVLHRILSKLGD